MKSECTYYIDEPSIQNSELECLVAKTLVWNFSTSALVDPSLAILGKVLYGVK